MAISATLLKNLIDDRELIITPYDAGMLKGNYYELSGKDVLYTYDSEYGENVTIDTKNPPKQTSIAIPKNGYILEPNRFYYVPLKETIQCPKYSCEITPSMDIGQYGMSINITNGDAFVNGNEIVVMLSAVYPVTIYPNQVLANLTLTASDTGASIVPIGGIIGWVGGTIPYGYCICDGSNGSPDLRNSFIYGSTRTGPHPGAILKSGIDIAPFDLIFIMRYK